MVKIPGPARDPGVQGLNATQVNPIIRDERGAAFSKAGDRVAAISEAYLELSIKRRDAEELLNLNDFENRARTRITEAELALQSEQADDGFVPKANQTFNSTLEALDQEDRANGKSYSSRGEEKLKFLKSQLAETATRKATVAAHNQRVGLAVNTYEKNLVGHQIRARETGDIAGSIAASETTYAAASGIGITPLKELAMRQTNEMAIVSQGIEGMIERNQIAQGTQALEENKGRLDLNTFDAIKTALVKSATENRDAQEIFAGRKLFDPGDSKDRKAVDNASEKMGIIEKFHELDGDGVADTVRIAKAIGYVPKPVVSELNAMYTNGTPEAQQYALQAMGVAMRQKPGVVIPGAAEMVKDSKKFMAMVQDLGIAPSEAVKRIKEQKTPEFKRNQATFKEEGTALLKNLSSGDIADYFEDNQRASFNRSNDLGTSVQSGRLMNAYKQAFMFHYEGSGDFDQAKSEALADLKHKHGVSAVLGQDRVMAHPPEDHYPVIDGGWEYIPLQLQDEVSKRAFGTPTLEEGLKNPPREMAGLRESLTRLLPPEADVDGIIKDFVLSDKDITEGRVEINKTAKGVLNKIKTVLALNPSDTGKQIPLSEIFLESVPQTDADINAGRYPGYAVVWLQDVNRDGIKTLQTLVGESTTPLVWRADPKALLEEQNKNQLNEKERQERATRDADLIALGNVNFTKPPEHPISGFGTEAESANIKGRTLSEHEILVKTLEAAQKTGKRGTLNVGDIKR